VVPSAPFPRTHENTTAPEPNLRPRLRQREQAPGRLAAACGMSAVMQHWLGGTSGGLVGAVLSHPLDTLKVRMMNDPRAANEGLLLTTRTVFASGGMSAMYRGAGATIMLIPATKGVLFGINGYACNVIRSYRVPERRHEKLSLPETIVGAMVAGVGACMVATPLERVKIMQQTAMAQQTLQEAQVAREMHSTGLVQRALPRPTTFWQGARELLHTSGPRGLYKGFKVSLLRDQLSYPIYFVALQWSMAHARRLTRTGESEPLPMYAVAMVGGFAGVAMWIPIVPLDMVKTRVQADSGLNKRYKGAWDCAVQTFKTEGPRAFMRGTLPLVLRTIPLEAMTFVGYEVVQRYN
jgi:solute carrier family 25 (mitochondrial carnitine/acylcarnitine transporter), member 20/29